MKQHVLTTLITLLSIGFLHSQSNDQNYVKTTVYKDGFMSSAVYNATSDQTIETVEYFDGLGRPIQTVGVRQGGNDKDIISHVEYDSFGRQEKEYLPIPGTANSGDFKVISVLNDIQNYYYSNHSGEWTSKSVSNPYSQKVFENSPLNRVLKQGAPGQDWKIGQGHEIEFGYSTNDGTTSTTKVRLYIVTLSSDYTPAPRHLLMPIYCFKGMDYVEPLR